MLEPPPVTENPLAQLRHILEALYMQINLLAEVRDALRDLDANLSGDRPSTATGPSKARK